MKVNENQVKISRNEISTKHEWAEYTINFFFKCFFSDGHMEWATANECNLYAFQNNPSKPMNFTSQDVI